MRSALLFLILFSLVSCVGYKLGGAKPSPLAGVNSIAVPMFSNSTQEPRAEALVTTAVTDALALDGTYRIANRDSADAVLEGSLASIDYNTLRSSRLDSLLSEELTNQVRIVWNLRDAKDPTKILARGTSFGTSSFFADSNLQTARRNALPDAFGRAARNLVSSLASGF